jgi:hypothetical protein
MSELGDAIKKMVQGDDELYSIVAKVISVDLNNRTCDVEPLNGDTPILAVRLQANIMMGDGFWFVPKMGSNVIVGFLSTDAAHLILPSELDKIEVIINNKTFQVSSNGVKIASATSDLKTEINTLLDEINSFYDLIIQPGLFIAGTLPVTILPTAITTLTQKKLKIQQLKQAINSFLT